MPEIVENGIVKVVIEKSWSKHGLRNLSRAIELFEGIELDLSDTSGTENCHTFMRFNPDKRRCNNDKTLSARMVFACFYGSA